MKLKSHLITLLFLVPALTVTVLVRLLSESIVGDDAYMTFRVVRNFLDGNGFVCNPGEYVISTTTPFFALVLAGVSYILGLPPDLAFPYICYLLDFFNVIFLFVLTYRVSGNSLVSGVSALFFSLSSSNIHASLLGMETPLFIFLLLLSTLLFIVTSNDSSNSRTNCLGFFFAVLLSITRPEGSFFAALYFIFRWIFTKRFPLDLFSVLFVVIVPWVVTLYLYFDTVIPQSLEAKSLGYVRLPGEALSAVIHNFTRLFFYPSGLLDFNYGLLLFFFLLELVLWGAIVAIRKERNLLIVPFFLVGFIIVYAVTNPFVFSWYLVPLEPFYCFLFIMGASNLIKNIYRFNRLIAVSFSGIISLLLFMAFLRYDALAIRVVNEWPADIQDSCADENEPDKVLFAKYRNIFIVPFLGTRDREMLYKEAAMFLEPVVTPETTVLGPEFGAFGYFSQAKVISSIGHVNPEIMKYFPLSTDEVDPGINTAIPVRMVKEVLPDYILSLDIFYRRTLQNDPWFQSNYTLIFSRKSRVFNSENLNLYVRYDLLVQN
ncbi:MAG TPA: hypothetical protein PKA63_07060 [Oligoflexia bacterium]|nr:hypothetical protein [Oligoflexia bacterium]HMP48409.1 hypothetical protein [Oligoflexia bacterium]